MIRKFFVAGITGVILGLITLLINNIRKRKKDNKTESTEIKTEIPMDEKPHNIYANKVEKPQVHSHGFSWNKIIAIILIVVSLTSPIFIFVLHPWSYSQYDALMVYYVLFCLTVVVISFFQLFKNKHK